MRASRQVYKWRALRPPRGNLPFDLTSIILVRSYTFIYCTVQRAEFGTASSHVTRVKQGTWLRRFLLGPDGRLQRTACHKDLYPKRFMADSADIPDNFRQVLFQYSIKRLVACQQRLDVMTLAVLSRGWCRIRWRPSDCPLPCDGRSSVGIRVLGFLTNDMRTPRVCSSLAAFTRCRHRSSTWPVISKVCFLTLPS